MRALGSLKTKPDAGSPPARPEPPAHFERAEQGLLHLYELDPTLQIPPRGLRRYWVIDALAERLDAREGVVARLVRELLRG